MSKAFCTFMHASTMLLSLTENSLKKKNPKLASSYIVFQTFLGNDFLFLSLSSIPIRLLAYTQPEENMRGCAAFLLISKHCMCAFLCCRLNYIYHKTFCGCMNS